MTNNPCDIYNYNSDKYNSCVKDVVYEAAQDEWIMLDPRFPNLKGVTPDKIDEIVQIFAEESQKLKEYCIDYLQHVMVYDRDDIFKMCINLGEQIEKKYPGKLHDPHSIFVTTPRGGHEVLSIFAYANDLKKEQIPSNIRSITEKEQKIINDRIKTIDKEHVYYTDYENAYNHIQEGNYPIIPDIWLNTISNYFNSKVETVFIIDDIIASGEQMRQAIIKIDNFFEQKVNIIPIVLVKREPWESYFYESKKCVSIFDKSVYDTETVGINEWNKARQEIKLAETGQTMSIGELEEVFKIYNSLITVRFPWGSPDGESDRIITKLYEGRRGLDRIERKQERCILEPEKCELK